MEMGVKVLLGDLEMSVGIRIVSTICKKTAI
jgi:hypothetical protein